MKKTITDLQAELDQLATDCKLSNDSFKHIALDAIGWPYKSDQIGVRHALLMLVNELKLERSKNTVLQYRLDVLETIAPFDEKTGPF